MHLDRHGASRSVDLATAAGIRAHCQSMMKIVHELEELELVTRKVDPTDSRAKLIEFTRAGQNLIEELTQSTETWLRYWGSEVRLLSCSAVLLGWASCCIPPLSFLTAR
jgi:DNA-binding MarR family transcriptional regulator